ncbi:phage baseplate assembly protein V [Kitasatospora purpeofusca]|uniref:Phage baseplate assembly protein V n=1 Tax=Kitasatospora purpeofusca TaxID=67352 RepID=A0ABZ1UCG2_9ACTN|nr:phage baseplate assembly protein V [Kitasatospora purpeofusca]
MTARTVTKWPGLYQGVVVSAVDTESKGRLLVRVPEVLGDEPCIWASSSSPVAGKDCGMYTVPPPDAGVWVQFIDGDPNRAVYTGFWRGDAGDVPSAAKSTPSGIPQIVLATPSRNALVISDQPGADGGILLQFHGSDGPFLKINESSIEIACGRGPGFASILLTGNQVCINGNALTVQ